ncbi:response regulator [bacterium 3DAC]|jgi:DNA-binding response OmpR family regulator|nr:response regulator transcription factor [Dictyoglomota bacterium]UZN23440.1 response regulator [bacterium 3DAC]
MSAKTKVLLVEDDDAILEQLRRVLTDEGYEVVSAMNGNEAIEKFKADRPDLILLDLYLPLKDGMDVLREIRRESDVPIIIITARDADIDKVKGLEIGADDYITKPFSLIELLARMKAVLRRAHHGYRFNMSNVSQLRAPGLILDLKTHQVIVERDGREEVRHLPRKQFELLKILMLKAPEVLEREWLLKEIWGNFMSNARTLDVHIHWLRNKIEEDPNNPEYILTVRKVGYRFGKPVEKIR